MALLVRKAVSLFLLYLICPVLFAQEEHRYMVFFTDKNNSSFSIDNPTAFLSVRALSRRTKHNIAIDPSDLPVNSGYVESLDALGVRTYFTTKWMNGVLVEMNNALVSTIEALTFVDRVELVAPGSQLLDSEIDRGPVQDPIVVAPGVEVRTDFQNEMVGIDEMHQQGYRGEGVLIAVLDSGFPNLSRIGAFSHLTDNSSILMTRDWTFNQVHVEAGNVHGLRVLSILAAQRDDFEGVVPEANYLLFITEDGRPDEEYRVEEYNWLFAAEAADSAGVDIISTSVGYSTFEDPAFNYTYEQMTGRTAVISLAAGLAFDKGILVLTSAGNEGNTSWQYITAPADHPNILAVGAVNGVSNKISSSSIGPNSEGVIKPDVAAFGSATSTINASGEVQLGTGTSYAAPIVSGLAAGLLQAMPELTNVQIANTIRASGSQAFFPDNRRGYGIPNFSSALEIIEQPSVTIEDGILVFPNPIDEDRVFVAFAPENFGMEHVIEVFSSDGSLIVEIYANPSFIKSRIEIDWSPRASGIYLLRITNPNGQFTRKLIKY